MRRLTSGAKFFLFTLLGLPMILISILVVDLESLLDDSGHYEPTPTTAVTCFYKAEGLPTMKVIREGNVCPWTL